MKSGELNLTTSTAAPGVLLVRLEGRLDAFGSKSFGESLEKALAPEVIAVAIDLGEVSYLSSAGLRVFTLLVKKLKERGGTLALYNLQEYCRDVFEISGMAPFFPILKTRSEALALCQSKAREKQILADWDSLEVFETEDAIARIIPGSDTAYGTVELLGDVKDVLHADIGENQIASKVFSETEYSIGCGALGDEVEDYFPIMGEMITIGGTMVWLPTDGHDTPDFLIPRKSSRAITLRTVFNACVEGGFNEHLLIESKDPKGIGIDRLYPIIFESAAKRRPDYRGVVGTAARVEFSAVYGAGIRKSPIRRFKPANGETILHPSNISDWFAGDHEPRLTDVTGLMCGIGIDLTRDLSHFDSKYVDAAFYRHPDNTGGKKQLLHNHAVFFSPQPMPEKMTNLAAEIQSVVENGDFKDMRHLLDQTRLRKAFIGLSYTQEIRADTRGLAS